MNNRFSTTDFFEENYSRAKFLVDGISYVVFGKSEVLSAFKKQTHGYSVLLQKWQKQEEQISIMKTENEKLLKLSEQLNEEKNQLEKDNDELSVKITQTLQLEKSQPTMVHNLLCLLGSVWTRNDELAKEIKNLARVFTSNGLEVCYKFQDFPQYFEQTTDEGIQEESLSSPALLRDGELVFPGQIFVPTCKSKSNQ